MSFFNDPKRIPESYGLRIAAGLIVYFFLMKILNLAHHVELRLLNLVILVIGVYFALKKLKEVNQHRLNYFRALITGFTTATIGSLIFALFLFIYMKVDSDMMQAIIEGEPMGRYLNAYIAAFIVALEGVFSGLLVTFVILNFVGTDEVNQ
jgi:glucose uptake protein GlcU